MHIYSLVLTTLVVYFGLHLGGRTEVPKELRAQLEDLDTTCNSSSFLESYEKMADVDIDPFEKHDKTDSHPDKTDLHPLPPVNPGGGSTWEPDREQEASFGGTRQKTEVLKKHVKALYHMCYPKSWAKPQKCVISIVSK